jgi:hypothetical protein
MAKRRKKHKGRGRPKGPANFYVFYDKNDFVTAFGTAEQLVADGTFSCIEYVHQKACRIKKGMFEGTVVVLPYK